VRAAASALIRSPPAAASGRAAPPSHNALPQRPARSGSSGMSCAPFQQRPCRRDPALLRPRCPHTGRPAAACRTPRRITTAVSFATGRVIGSRDGRDRTGWKGAGRAGCAAS
jgi:hypothetical protein